MIENNKKEEAKTVVPVIQPTTNALVLNDQNDLKKYIFKSGKSVFLSQISSMNQEKATELFNREASFAVQHMANMPEKGKPFFMSCVQRNPMSLLFAISNIASSGLTLNPDLKLAYLVPKDGKISYQSSWMGKKELMIQSGLCKDVTVHIVRSKDVFSSEGGTNPSIIHKADHFNERGEIVGGYAIAFMTNGAKHPEIMTLDEIKKIQKVAGTQYIWNAWFEEMAKKTLVNRLFKNIPKLNANLQLLALLKHESTEFESEFNEIETKEETDDYED